MQGASSTAIKQQQLSSRHAELLIAKVAIASGVASIIAGWFDGDSGLLTVWDHYGITIISFLYIASGIVTYRLPRYSQLGLVVGVFATCVYQQGVMYWAVNEPSTASYYSAASSGSFFPIVYLVMFIALPRLAVHASWMHCALFYGQFVLNALLHTGPHLPGQDEARHLLLELMVSHPIYVLALSYIVNLREQVYMTQVEAHQEKERFLGMLSHEIRGMLQNMVYSLDLLALHLKTEVGKKVLSRLMGTSAQLQKYLEDVGELTKLESPALTTQSAVFDFRESMAVLVEEWKPLAMAKGLVFEASLGKNRGDEPLYVYSDPARLVQVVSNLLANALKYTISGRVELRVDVFESPSKHIEISVIDTGIGIERSLLSKIFEPYVRLENARATTERGSGLGLTIVRQLVIGLGGEIRVESEIGRGTTFWVSVPG